SSSRTRPTTSCSSSRSSRPKRSTRSTTRTRTPSSAARSIRPRTRHCRWRRSLARVTTLPRGTVTLLFTDVEGSTGLAEALGDVWAQVLEEHRRILRAEVVARWGIEVDCRGDELFAVFTDAVSAVQAAAAAQRALGAHA